ncbi:hypothetical protein N658DRAFT_561370 [Parathielavia hyrcaniae]|uniref:Uncharacterized protein n=1 Tax=Parathielavia hyrcaniae TaxID=113614 RepID=A0AAN6PU16_9PEZI|nr:hypothetical protein N658DRAFT_561370 [Parathielavia hyrcaniae]
MEALVAGLRGVDRPRGSGPRRGWPVCVDVLKVVSATARETEARSVGIVMKKDLAIAIRLYKELYEKEKREDEKKAKKWLQKSGNNFDSDDDEGAYRAIGGRARGN